MADDRDGTGDKAALRELLTERPSFESALRAILETEERVGTPWTFDDIPVDSGRFGELVGRGIVTKTDTGYRIADPDEVRALLDGETVSEADTTAVPSISAAVRAGPSIALPSVFEYSRETALLLLVAFGSLFAFRSVNYPAVFREEAVVLPANDPYHYRYWVDQLLAADLGLFDFGEVGSVLGGRANGEPLTYVTGWWISNVLGQTPETAGTIIAWLPVLAAIATGGFVYGMAVLLTRDRRIGIAAVGMFAIIPTHAVYSGIGFFDHHTFDYVILAGTATGLVGLGVDIERRIGRDPDSTGRYGIPVAVLEHLRRPWTWVVAVGIGLAIAIQVHLWNGSPLLLLAIAGYIAMRALSDIRADHPSLVANAPLLVALGVGALLAHLFHGRWGWQESMVVYTPAMILVGGIAVFGAAELVRRMGLHSGIQLGLEVGAAVVVLLTVWFVRPEYVDRLRDRSSALFGREGIAETRPMFAADWGFVLGPMDHFGTVFFLAAPVLLVAAWWVIQAHRPAWLVLVVYGWYLTVLSGIQVRFTGELSPFVAVAAGIGFVHLLSVLDIARRPVYDQPVDRPHPRRAESRGPRNVRLPSITGMVYGGVILLIVVGLSVMLLWSVTSFIAIEDDQYEAAMWIANDVEAGGSGPDFVLSEWSWNRMYNYHVSGEADTYGFAERFYDPFVLSTDPDSEFYDQFAGTVGYVVIEDRDVDLPAETAYVRLLDHREDRVEGFAHYRAVFVTSNDEIVVFELVEGATIQADAEPGEPVTATTTVEGDGLAFEYVRTETASAAGVANVTVAYPGQYTVNGDSIEVDESAIRNGETVEI